MTASIPRSEPSASRTTGMPPPPLATTTKPASTRACTAGASRISSGSGEATTRRQPFSPRSSQVSPCSTSRAASSAGRNRPIGLVGLVKPGSSMLTSARVTSAAVRRSTPRRASSASRASIRTNPSVAWVCAPHQSSGTGGTTAAASSFFTSRLPTWGPLPWVTTTSAPVSRSARDGRHRDLGGRDLVLDPGPALRVRHGVATQRQQDPHASDASGEPRPPPRHLPPTPGPSAGNRCQRSPAPGPPHPEQADRDREQHPPAGDRDEAARGDHRDDRRGPPQPSSSRTAAAVLTR